MDRLQRQFNRSVCIKLSEKDCLVHRSLSTVLSPSHMGPCASSPVPRISRSPLRENEVPEREAGRRTFRFRGEKIFNELEPLFNENSSLHFNFALRLRLFFIIIFIC